MRRKRNSIRQNDGTKRLHPTRQQIQKQTRPPRIRRNQIRIPTRIPQKHRRTKRLTHIRPRRRHTQIRTTRRRTSPQNTKKTTRLARRTIQSNRMDVRTRSQTRQMEIQPQHMVRTTQRTPKTITTTVASWINLNQVAGLKKYSAGTPAHMPPPRISQQSRVYSSFRARILFLTSFMCSCFFSSCF